MPRRRINQQQTRRIDARQARIVENSDDAGLATHPGLVIARYGKTVIVENEAQALYRCHLRANLPALVAGDRVEWQIEGGNTGVVLAQRPRQNALRRPDARGALKPVAANIDLMLIVIAPLPEPHANLIDRYLVAAEYDNIPCALVLNKADLLADDDKTLALLGRYEALGYPTVVTGRQQPDAHTLRTLIDGKTLVFVGQSGVGKSSLIQRLVPERNIRVGSLSDAADKGRHTTTTAELFHLPGGGHLIDSPGIREFHLHHISAPEVAAGFREFLPFLGSCKFRDCAHRHERDCALQAAVLAGDISAERFDSYLHIVDSLTPPA